MKESARKKQRKLPKKSWELGKKDAEDEEVISSDEDDDVAADETSKKKAKKAEADPREQEDALDKRNRLAKDLLKKISSAKKRQTEDEEEEEAQTDEFEDTDKALRKEVLRSEGRLLRSVADELAELFASEPVEHKSYRSSHSQTVTAVCISSDETTCYSGSKDGAIVGWDVETNTSVWKPKKPQGSRVLALACSSDGKYLASCGDKTGSTIRIWDLRANNPDKPIREMEGHRDVVTSLAFRQNSSVLLSGSDDRSVRLYNAAEGAFIEHLFGHYSRVCAVDCLSRERCITASEDMTVRLWKIPEETHLLLSGRHSGPIDCVKMLNENVYVSGSQDGNLALWSVAKRRPVSVVTDAHGPGRWIESVAALPNADVVASGSDDGLIRLWQVDLDRMRILPDPIAAIPCAGHVNSLAIAPTSASFIVAGTGQEPRLGRWRVNQEAKNVVHIYRLPRVEMSD